MSNNDGLKKELQKLDKEVLIEMAIGLITKNALLHLELNNLNLEKDAVLVAKEWGELGANKQEAIKVIDLLKKHRENAEKGIDIQ
ncbi:MAG TPA: hypothetical protein VMX17_06710 [Candidatus Glassbacteria bacterium]|nr:hypothetical protein [Candidatus Glassbacteria bacterium]